MACGIQLPDQRSNPGPLHLECVVLATEQAGKFQSIHFLFELSYMISKLYLNHNFGIKIIHSTLSKESLVNENDAVTTFQSSVAIIQSCFIKGTHATPHTYPKTLSYPASLKIRQGSKNFFTETVVLNSFYFEISLHS